MSSRYSLNGSPFPLCLLVAIAVTLFCEQAPAQSTSAPGRRVLHIAADPNNLPFSNDRLEGFENKIASLVARELNADIQYIWHAQRRGFFRQTMKEGDADLVMGVPSDFERTATTKPYYRSSYVFVSRADKHLDIKSLDDPRLRTLKTGVLLIGDDDANTPPAHSLANRGIVTNVVGFSIYGNYAEQNPPARIVEAVARGDIDTAIVWGPLAGFFAPRQQTRLELIPVSPETDGFLPFTFEISIGVKRKNKVLRDEVNKVLTENRAEIGKILAEYHVPCLPVGSPKLTQKD